MYVGCYIQAKNMEEEYESHFKLVSSLQVLATLFTNAVEAARRELEASFDVYEFLKYRGKLKKSQLFTVAVYGTAECMKKLGVGTRAEMEELWGEHLGKPDVKEAVDALLKAEKSWLDFVEEVENKLTR